MRADALTYEAVAPVFSDWVERDRELGLLTDEEADTKLEVLSSWRERKDAAIKILEDQ